MSDRPCVAKSVITNSSILRDVVQNLSGENRVEIAQDFGRTEIVRAGVGTGYDLACCVDKNQTRDSGAGVFPNCVFALKFWKIDRWPRHVCLALVSFHRELRFIEANKDDLEFRMLCCDAIVVIDQLRCEFAARRAPMRRKVERDQLFLFQLFVIEMAEPRAAEVAGIVKETMENIYPLAVPLAVDTRWGRSWYDAKD